MLRGILFGSMSLSSYLSWRSRWFIKHPVIIKHSLIVCECVCLCAGVSPGNYLMPQSLMTTQTNICPQVIYKMKGWPSVVLASVRACMMTRASLKTYTQVPEPALSRRSARFLIETLHRERGNPGCCCNNTQTITKHSQPTRFPLNVLTHTHAELTQVSSAPQTPHKVMSQEQIFTSQASDPNK